LLDQSLFTLTSLQEDPTLQHLETEVWELQQAYGNVRGTVEMVTLSQQLAKMRETQALKEQVDTACQKEAVLKERIQPWLEEAFTVKTKIKGKLAQMQGIYALKQGIVPDNNASKIRTQLEWWIVDEYVTNLSEVQRLLDGLCVKITAPAE